MEWVKASVLGLHIASGFLCLVTGFTITVLQKGTRKHGEFGIMFTTSMGIACTTGLLLSLLSSNPFLLMVAIFSGYGLIHGVRSMKFVKGAFPSLLDKVVFYASLSTHVLFLAYGVVMFTQYGFHLVALLSILFGLGGLSLNASFSNKLFHPPSNIFLWKEDHITGMMTAFIASVTAFSSTSLHLFLPNIIAWIWPTILFAPLIPFWIKRERNKTR
jgi:hypothetical protein